MNNFRAIYISYVHLYRHETTYSKLTQSKFKIYPIFKRNKMKIKLIVSVFQILKKHLIPFYIFHESYLARLDHIAVEMLNS